VTLKILVAVKFVNKAKIESPSLEKFREKNQNKTKICRRISWEFLKVL
jgi:hypothetical protein